MSDPNNKLSWMVIDKLFKDNPYLLVNHHLESFNNFYESGINKIFKENNPVRFSENSNEKKEKLNEISMYMGGKDGKKIYFGKPIIYENAENSYMYPNIARLRNLTYSMTIHYDIEVDYTYYDDEGQLFQSNETLEKIYLGKFPIMLHSNMCILKNLPKEVKFNMGECYNDLGGYFIISGKEKVIISQEDDGDNMIQIQKHKQSDIEKYIITAKIHSVSEDPSKPVRNTFVRMLAPSSKFTNKQLLVDIANVRKPVPLFILMRALGITSDKDIIEMCLLDLEKNKDLIDLFIPSIHDAGQVFTQQTALEYIASFTKRQTVVGVMEILMNYLLPHIGELNFLDKAYYVGFMVHKLLRVYSNKELETDRDSFKYKRIILPGNLIYNLFREYYLIQNKNIAKIIDKEHYYGIKKGLYSTSEDFFSLINKNITSIFKEKLVETGFKKAFKGNWGSTSHTKMVGVVQDLNRLSWNGFMSHLRKINLDIGTGTKLVKPRLLNSTQWGIIDPLDTPDGANIGTHKHLAIGAIITSGFSVFPLIKFIRKYFNIYSIQECNPIILATFTKFFINGIWLGVIENPIENVALLKLYRRNGIIPIYTSITFNIEDNIIYIFTDAGRLVRPIYYTQKGYPSYFNLSHTKSSSKSPKGDSSSFTISKEITDKIIEASWSQLVSGFLPKPEGFDIKNGIVYEDFINEINGSDLESVIENFSTNKAIIDYIDTSEEENTLIAISPDSISLNKYYTHLEINPSLILGVMGNQIPYPECNQLPRDLFSCGQSKQAVSMYNTNYQLRIDKMAVVLNYGQTPLIKTKYLSYFNNEEMAYGVNATVAIMSYTGYNVEDAILINKGSVDRGIFNTTYFTGYVSYEESSKVAGSMVDSVFSNVDTETEHIQGKKKGSDYSHLDQYGLIKEETPIDDTMIIIGKITKGEVWSDSSTGTKKGQLGIVDKCFVTEGEEGTRIAKVRIREERIPAIGDKMGSRHGQKGTIGLIISEDSMPFAEDGTRPDLIINPHALPSRMTIGQLVECLFGKVCTSYGAFGDCTAFSYNGPNMDKYGKMLNDAGFHSSGNQVLYNGMNGEQLQSDIFIGPTYYMRLKHMVKDKINHRSTGPKTSLTRQSVHGRALDGGLRIGEMEAQGLIAYGASKFVNTSFLERGDLYYMAVCNKSGSIAIYNNSKNIFLSPFVDGPIQFHEDLKGNMNVKAISKFGRSFSILKIPYSLKLIIQELQAMNIQMRLITDANVDQLLNLSYSKNINNLLRSDEPLSNLIPAYEKEMINKLAISNKLSSEEVSEYPSNIKFLTHSPEGPSPSQLRNEPTTPQGPPPSQLRNEPTTPQGRPPSQLRNEPTTPQGTPPSQLRNEPTTPKGTPPSQLGNEPTTPQGTPSQSQPESLIKRISQKLENLPENERNSVLQSIIHKSTEGSPSTPENILQPETEKEIDSNVGLESSGENSQNSETKIVTIIPNP